MANINVSAAGNAAGAIAALEALKSSIASVQGKTVRLHVEVDGLRDAARNLGTLNRQMERASGLAGGMSEVGDHFSRLGGQIGQFGRDVSTAHDGLRATNRQVSTLNRHVARTAELGDSFDQFNSRVGTLGRSLGGLGDGVQAVTRSGAGLGSTFAGAGSDVIGFGGSAAGVLGGVARGVGAVAVGMGAVAVGAGLAAAASGIATGAVGAMGVASVGAFGLVGAGMGAAAGTFVGHAVDVLSESSKFRGEFKAISRDMQSWQEDVYEPVGDAVVGLARSFRAAGPGLGAPIKSGLGVARDAVLDAAPDLVRGSQTIADSIGRITKDTAPSITTLTRSFPALASSTTGAVEEVTRAFNAGFQDQWPRAVPHVQRLTGAVGAFGAEVMRTGASNLIPMVDGMQTLTESATQMTRNLGPSIPKAMSAFTDVGDIIMDSIGSPQVAEGIDKFTDSIARNKGPLTAMGGDLAAASFAAGSGFVDGLGRAQSATNYMANSLERNQQAISDVIATTVGGVAGAIGFGADLFVGAPAELARNIGWLFGAGGESPAPPPGALAGPPPGVAAPKEPLTWANAWEQAGLARGSKVVPSHEIPGLHGTTPFQVPDLPSHIDPGTGEMTGPKADAIKKQFDITGPYYTDIAKAPPPAPFVSSPVPGMSGIPVPGPQFRNMLPPPPPPQPGPVDSLDALLNGEVRPRVGSSIGGITRRQIQDAAPEVQEAGAALGGAGMAGLDQGLQTSVTRTETVMRKTIRKVIDVAADEMDAHSPSREFEKLGFSAPQGLAVGFERGASLAESASARVTRNVLAAAGDSTAMTRAGLQAGQSYATGLGTGMAPGAVLPGAGAGMTTPPGTPPPNIGGPGGRAGLVDQGQLAAEQRAGLQPAAASSFTGVGGPGAQAGLVDPLRRAAPPPAGPQVEELGPQDTFTARQEAHNRRAEDIRERAQRNKERAMRQANPEMTDSQFSRMLDTRAPGKTSFTYSTYTPATTPDFSGQPGGLSAMAARAQGKDVGTSYGQGMGQGLTGSRPVVMRSAKGLAVAVGAATRDELEVRSPSQVARRIGADYSSGLGQGMAGAIGSASSAVRGVANNSGLKLGNVWGRSVVTGADAVIQKDLFQAMSVPTLESPQAKAALAARGLLGPAGSGASIWKTPAVSFGGREQPPVRVVIENKTYLDSELVLQKTHQQTEVQLDEAFGGFASFITQQ